jgi:hypothetical protein
VPSLVRTRRPILVAHAAGGLTIRGLATLLTLAFGPAAIAQTGGLRLDPIPKEATGAQDDLLVPATRHVGSDGAVDETNHARAFVELASARATGFVGEVLAIEVRFGLDAEFLDQDLIALFRRRLDLPVQLESAWLDDPDVLATTAAFARAPDGAQSTFARNAHLARARRVADRSVDGRSFRVFALDVRRTAREPGTLRIECPRLVFARGLSFTDDFLSGRTATERRDAFVAGTALEIAIAPLPEADRPREFSGSVGEFELEARCEVGGDAARTTARLELTLRGDGDLSRAIVADAADFPGFALLGVLDDHGRARREVVFDLERRAPGVRQVPSIAFHSFDPRPPGAYRVERSPTFELPAAESTVAQAPIEEPVAGPGFGARVALLAGAAAVALGIAGFLALRWRRRPRE